MPCCDIFQINNNIAKRPVALGGVAFSNDEYEKAATVEVTTEDYLSPTYQGIPSIAPPLPNKHPQEVIIAAISSHHSPQVENMDYQAKAIPDLVPAYADLEPNTRSLPTAQVRIVRTTVQPEQDRYQGMVNTGMNLKVYFVVTPWLV